MTYYSTSDRHHAGRVKSLLMEIHITALIQVQIHLKIVLLGQIRGWFPRVMRACCFFAGGGQVGQTLQTAAPLYKGEGMIGLQHMGRQHGKNPPHQSECCENLLTGSSPRPLHTQAHEIFNH